MTLVYVENCRKKVVMPLKVVMSKVSYSLMVTNSQEKNVKQVKILKGW